MPELKRFAILDRDGTIIVEKNYLKSVEQLELLPNSAEGLRALAAQGLGLIAITNQSGVGRGLITVEEVEAIHAELIRRLKAEGVELARIYYCAHAPSDDCNCRKPNSHLALKAARELGFRLEDAIFIGDKESDIAFGHNSGGRAILVRTGYGSQYESATAADAVADDLSDAARIYSRSMWK